MGRSIARRSARRPVRVRSDVRSACLIGQDSRLHFSGRAGDRESWTRGYRGSGGVGVAGAVGLGPLGRCGKHWGEARRGDGERGGVRPELPGGACFLRCQGLAPSLPPEFTSARLVAERPVRGRLCPRPGPSSSSGRNQPRVGFFRPQASPANGVVIGRLLAQRRRSTGVGKRARPLLCVCLFSRLPVHPRVLLACVKRRYRIAVKFWAPVWTVLAATFTLDELLGHNPATCCFGDFLTS